MNAAREVHSRNFLERHNHEARQLRKLIEAMLDTDESACGDSQFLLESREQFHKFFDIGSLPDPTQNGYRHLAADEWEGKFESSLRRFYHHLSEKHDGELIELSRVVLPGCVAEHPVHGNEWLPEVHSPQFFDDDDLPPDVRTRGIAFFKNKWWRGEEAASGAKDFRDQFIADMWNYPNAVWAPLQHNEWLSKTWKITFHSLDSLVWEAVQQLPFQHGGHDVNFGDLYGRLP